jgi:hypothetical protein
MLKALLGDNLKAFKEQLKNLAGTKHFWETLLFEARKRRMSGDRTEFMAEYINLDEATVVLENDLERLVPWRLVQFEDLDEKSDEWEIMEEDLSPIFNPSRQKKYSERLCMAVERPSDSWKLKLT